MTGKQIIAKKNSLLLSFDSHEDIAMTGAKLIIPPYLVEKNGMADKNFRSAYWHTDNMLSRC